MGVCHLIAVTLLLSLSVSASAIVYTASPVYGLMQQPTSQYYHTVYGGSLDLRTNNSNLIARISYIERPQFEAAGYLDQEYGGFALLGTSVLDEKSWRLRALFGGGQIEGYTRPVNAEASYPRRNFKLRGVTLELELVANVLRTIELGITHLTHVGWIDERQLSSYVAWPYNFFLVRVGISI